MNQFVIQKNEYLEKDIKAFFHTYYARSRQAENPKYVLTLKNNFKKYNDVELRDAMRQLYDVLLSDLPQVLQACSMKALTVCVVPRSKAEKNYDPRQLGFKRAVKEFALRVDGFCDGTDYMIRHSDTKTTHLQRAIKEGRIYSHENTGEMPYVGITNDTCLISDEVEGKDIVLIDDIYTKTVGIDEDAIQALLDKGARSVVFYSIGRTV